MFPWLAVSCGSESEESSLCLVPGGPGRWEHTAAVLPRGCMGAALVSRRAWAAERPASPEVSWVGRSSFSGEGSWRAGAGFAVSSGSALQGYLRTHVCRSRQWSPWGARATRSPVTASFSLAGHLDTTALLPLGLGKAVSGLVLGLVHWESRKVRASGGGPRSWLFCVRERRKATLLAVTVAVTPGSITASLYRERNRGRVFTGGRRP